MAAGATRLARHPKTDKVLHVTKVFHQTFPGVTSRHFRKKGKEYYKAKT
jgi:hypothetical protein